MLCIFCGIVSAPEASVKAGAANRGAGAALTSASVSGSCSANRQQSIEYAEESQPRSAAGGEKLPCSMLSPDRRTCKKIVDEAAVKGGEAVHFTLDGCRAMITIHIPDQDFR